MTEWRQFKLKDILEPDGYIRGPFGSSLRRGELKNEGIPVYEQEHAIKGIRKFRYYIDQNKFNELKRFCVKTGDIIISCSGTVGEVSVIKEEDPKGIISQALLILRADKNVAYQPFLKYFLMSPYGKSSITSRSDGSVQVNIAKRQVIENIDILLPPLPEQKAIAEVLSSLDDKIDLLTRQNKTLEDLAQAYFRKWFIEDASDEWEVGKLGDYIEIHDSKRVPLSKIEREKMKSGTLYPYYGAATIMDYVNDYIFDGEYILMGEDGTVETEDGYPVLQYATGKFWVNNHAHVLTAKSPFNNYFIWFFLKQCNISGIVTGAVQPKINQENLKNIDIPIPDLTLINSANQFFANIFAKILNNLEQIKTFQKLRDTLLPKLISGEIRLKM
jgi:type I restriction enzyme S subunit